MENEETKENKKIEKKENHNDFSIIQNIHIIRGQSVMLDYDLAKRYEVETRTLKQAVKRNIERFPPDFMFEITREEYNSLRSQIVTLDVGGRGKYSKYQPFVFTELGVAMLSSVLNSEKAIKVNIDIMRAFVAMRQYLLGVAELKRELDDFMRKTNMQFNEIYQLLEAFMKHKKELEKPRTQIGFKQSNNK
jgi:hypothetical protein